jgi:predicted Zn-dependent protease
MADRDKLGDIVRLSDRDTESMLRSALEAYSAGQLKQAETILVGLIALDETDVRPVKLLASCLFLSDRHRDAEGMYEKARAMDPDDPYTIVALAEIRLKALQLDSAIELFEQLFALDPERTHPAANRGRQLVRRFHDLLVKSR